MAPAIVVGLDGRHHPCHDWPIWVTPGAPRFIDPSGNALALVTKDLMPPRSPRRWLRTPRGRRSPARHGGRQPVSGPLEVADGRDFAGAGSERGSLLR